MAPRNKHTCIPERHPDRDVACHRYTMNMQVSSGTKNNSSTNEPSCTTITVSSNGVLLVVTGTWRSSY
ncbi:uncharacterized protein TNCV_5115911 [Trichonephila clavipes]|nr:uncharacterized protein TNCV_5115911 [Trichonephila clavipes]